MDQSESITDDIRSLLPLYANNSLSPVERQRVAAWLDRYPQGRAELESWQQVRSSLRERPRLAPTQECWFVLLRHLELQNSRRVFGLAGTLAGIALAVISLILFWITIRPGVMLQWSVDGDNLALYRVYRAPAGSQDFVLLGEVTGIPGVRQYTYLDALFLPWQPYIYQVEGIAPSGSPVVSQRVVNQPMAALPGQAAILIASILLGYFATSIIRNWHRFRLDNMSPT